VLAQRWGSGPAEGQGWEGGDETVASSGLDLTGLLRPVREGNAFEETVERLLTVIKLGVVGPGERFPAERELAAQLGISRPTLREAIRELQQAGYVESRRGRSGGTFVTGAPPVPDQGELRRLAREDGDKLTDALTFRLVIEAGAAEALAQVMARSAARSSRAGRRPPPAISLPGSLPPAPPPLPDPASGAEQPGGPDARQVLLARLADVNGACPQDYRRLDTLFHLSIAELTGSSLLAAACADARMRFNDLLNAIPVLQRNIDHTAGQHAAIANAILAGDAERARRAVAEHLEGTAALLRGFLT
jgi:DNA-binding FadR family transcriptional regulator